jgi:hypothetical protein
MPDPGAVAVQADAGRVGGRAQRAQRVEADH